MIGIVPLIGMLIIAAIVTAIGAAVAITQPQAITAPAPQAQDQAPTTDMTNTNPSPPSGFPTSGGNYNGDLDDGTTYRETENTGGFESSDEGEPDQLPAQCTIPKYFRIHVYNPEIIEIQGTNRKYLYFKIPVENEGNVNNAKIPITTQFFYKGVEILKKETEVSLSAGYLAKYYVPFPRFSNIGAGEYQITVTATDACRITDCAVMDLFGTSCWGVMNSGSYSFNLNPDIINQAKLGMEE